ISVSDLIKKAGIVRTTFYNHYENMDYFIEAMEDKTVKEIFDIMETFNLKSDYEICRQYFITICSYTRENLFIGKVLRSNRGNEFLRKAMLMFHEYVRKKVKDNEEVMEGSEKDSEFSYMIASTIGCTLGVIHKWTEDGFDAPVEEIADILTVSFLNGCRQVGIKG
nr:TetR/AcrR family transcriptional regulator [Lachnospiraceae bacterium]